MGPARDRETGRMTLGSMNHLGITVSDLAASTERFYAPLLGFLGYRLVESLPEMSLWLAPEGQAINLWQAHAGLAGQAAERYAPGFHHFAFNADRRARVDRKSVVEGKRDAVRVDFGGG